MTLPHSSFTMVVIAAFRSRVVVVDNCFKFTSHEQKLGRGWGRIIPQIIKSSAPMKLRVYKIFHVLINIFIVHRKKTSIFINNANNYCLIKAFHKTQRTHSAQHCVIRHFIFLCELYITDITFTWSFTIVSVLNHVYLNYSSM